MLSNLEWIAVDWGTTHLRAYALDNHNNTLAQGSSANGMGKLKPEDFEPALLELISDWLPESGAVKVISCGMVGARQGWVEAPYQSVPCPPFAEGAAISVDANDSRLEVYILPGVSLSSPADVMRGEETQVAGFLETSASHNATLCLPGTHSKWVTVVDGEVVDFSTYMTGEMFNIISEHSILRFSVDSPEWNDKAFEEGVEASINKPQNWLNSCFSLRAEGLLNDLSAPKARSYLSGLMIGAEVVGSERYWSGQSVTLIGDLKLSQLYVIALSKMTAEPQVFDPKTLTLSGLCRAYQSLKTSTGTP